VPDRGLWFTEYAGNKITRAIYPAGPVITSVNAAHGGYAIAQNTWIVIKGVNLVPAATPANGVTWTTAPSFASGQMPAQLGGISVSVNGKAAYVYFFCSAVTSPICSQDQINVLTPLDSAVGSVAVVVTTAMSPTAAFTVPMTAVAPGFLLFDGRHIVATHADNSLLGPTTLFPGNSTPAKPGEQVALYGIGFGLPVSPLINGSASQSGLLPMFPACQMGGKTRLPAVVNSAALISPGLYQLNLTIPLGAADGENGVTCVYSYTDTGYDISITVQR
jgi:uncharacterized protein (TIGR03437 family)